jgi:hypothetical protein
MPLSGLGSLKIFVSGVMSFSELISGSYLIPELFESF